MRNRAAPVDVGEIVTEIKDVPLDDLVRSWQEVQDGYDYWAPEGEHDSVVLDCAARLAADPGGGTSYAWVLGLTMMAPHVARSGGHSRAEAEAALRAADTALRTLPCGHDAHPYQSHDGYDADAELPEVLAQIADESAEVARFADDLPLEVWRCPRNVAGYARIALDILRPGEVADVPPRLSLEHRENLVTLEALLELYPRAGTDVDDEIASQGGYLYFAEPEERPGRLQVVRAVSWHAVSGMVRDRSVLDNLITGVEKVLPDFAGAACDHAEHPTLSEHSTSAAELGILLCSPAGRALYERDRDHYGGGASLDQMMCPAFMAEIAQETLTELRTGRDRLFGPRDTSHLDAEYLGADGSLDIEKIAERLENAGRNEKYTDELGLWAARRYERLGQADPERQAGHVEQADHVRERVVLLLTAHRAMTISYPSPPPAVTGGVLTIMRAVADAPRPEQCTHADAHPPLSGGHLHAGLPHFYAPARFPPTGEVHSVQSWTCPRFLGEVAETCVGDLEALGEERDEEEW
jgi:hypothetical protein